MEQSLDLVITSLELISHSELSSHHERNYVERNPAATNVTSTLEPVVSTTERSKNEVPQVTEGIGAVINMGASCCCGPSPVRIAETPREKQPLCQRTCGCGCGCSTGEQQKCAENVVKTTDYHIEIKPTLGSQAKPKRENILDPDS